MRATVALVETRPETIGEDMERVLKLAGFDPPSAPSARLVATAGPAGGWFPGAATTPWQAAAAGARFTAGDPPLVFVMDEMGRPVSRPDPALAAGLLADGAVLAEPRAWARRPVRPVADLPLLTRLLDGDLSVPAGLYGEPLVLLPTPVIGGGWPLAGAVALLARLLAPARGRRWRGPPAEYLVEVVRLAREVLHVTGALLDGTMWTVRSGAGRRDALQGNVLVAGRDPVAVDAVACRMAGGDPARVPWLRTCAAAGIGAGDPRDIRLVGRTDLQNLGLAVPRRLLEPAPRLAPSHALADAAWRWLRRPAALRRQRGSAWVRLHRTGRGADSAGDP